MLATTEKDGRQAGKAGLDCATFIQERFASEEARVLIELDVEARLRKAFATPKGIRAFAESFDACRAGFVRANFVLGSRCPNDERYWVGLARNLYEEAGGGVTLPHNTLYKRFLTWASPIEQKDLIPQRFGDIFDAKWQNFASKADILTALVGFAIYEVFDAPDYSLLHRAFAGFAPAKVLEFFATHIEVRHIELFNDVFSIAPAEDELGSAIQIAGQFVLDSQREMWIGLLDHVEYNAHQR